MGKWKRFRKELKEDWAELKDYFKTGKVRTEKSSEKAEETESESNKRNFVRMNTFYKIKASLVIIRIDDYNVRTEEEEVILKDISANGVAFLTSQYIDLNRKIKAEIKFKLINEHVELTGELVRLETVGDPFDYLYGVRVDEGNFTEDEMYKLLMKTGIQFKNATSDNSSIWKEYKNLWV